MAFLVSQICLILWCQQTRILHEPFPADAVFPSEGGLSFGDQNEPAREGAGEKPGVSDLPLPVDTRKTRNRPMDVPNLRLDPKTDTFTPPDNHAPAVFDPSVFPNERIWVLDVVRINRDGRLEAAATPRMEQPLQTFSNPDPDRYRFFWARFVIPDPPKAVLWPTVATGMQFSDLPDGILLTRNQLDMITFIPAGNSRPGPVRLRVVAPNSYFEPMDLTRVRVPVPARFAGAPQLRDMSVRVFGKPDPAFLDRMKRYFLSFDVLPLLPHDSRMSLEEAILLQKRGVCRHRALLFFGIANAWGYETRLVLNEVHAFVEIRLPGKSWTRLDLGGAELPPSFVPPGAPGIHSPIRYRYRISGNQVVSSREKLVLDVKHLDSPPAFLWAIVLDSTGKEIHRINFFPGQTTKESFRMDLPELGAGRYRLVLRPAEPLRP